MNPPRVALLTFGDNRAHEWEKVFKTLTEEKHEQALNYFSRMPVELHASADVVRHQQEIDARVDEMKIAGAETLIAHVPCWTSPNLVVRAVQRAALPTVVLSNRSPATHGTVGFLGTCGTLDQIGYPHLRLREDFQAPNPDNIADSILPYLRAVSARTRLRGKVFGLFGGRSLGIDTGTFDPMQWKNIFGVDTEHIDQLEIIRRTETVSEEKTRKMLKWLEKSVARVDYGKGNLTMEKLTFQVRCYIAVKDIIAEKGLDFVAIKCMPDLSTFYVPQCISAALLPSPFDAEGTRDPVMMACEADADAALTMEILKLVTGGKASMFADVSYIDHEEQVLYLPNCGALCSWYAQRSVTAEENMKEIELRPANRPGGGAITYFTASPGPLTLARLFRKNGCYHMAIASGRAVELSPEKHEAFVNARGNHQLPTAFVKTDQDLDRLIQGFGSNHILATDGDYLEELEYFCQIQDITPERY